jgi:hypothetical protein
MGCCVWLLLQLQLQVITSYKKNADGDKERGHGRGGLKAEPRTKPLATPAVL